MLSKGTQKSKFTDEFLFFSPVVLSVIPGLAASTQPGNLLEMQIFRFFPRSTESEDWQEIEDCLTSLLGDAEAHSSVGTDAPGYEPLSLI